MILLTGGLGFIGSHTARALLDLGEDVVASRYRTVDMPGFLSEELGRRLFVEPADVADPDALKAIGRRYPIDGVLHLATAGLSERDLAADVRTNVSGVLTVVRAAAEWRVRRLALASSIAVYAGVDDRPLREDMPLPVASPHPIAAFKKTGEILGGHAGARLGVPVVHLRIAAIFGPLYRSMANAPSRMVHAAVRGTPVMGPPIRADDSADLCYVVDCARGIALLQTARDLPYDTFNIGSGRATANREVAEAITARVPDARLELESGPAAIHEGPLDLTRIHEAVGYRPAYDVTRAIDEYITWLRDGHER
jgi:UDP-glucose 4-epimerase